jgi:membrane protein DedA with SNARE-associated domain
MNGLFDPGGAAGLAAVLMVVLGLVAEIEDVFLSVIHQVFDNMGWAGVVFLMGVESAAIPFPSELIMPLAGWLLVAEKGGGWWMLVMAGLYGALGNLLGSWLAYWVSLKGGRPLLLKYGKYVLLTADEIERTERWFQRYGEMAVFFARLLPVVRTFISIPAGIARMNIWKFSVYTFFGSFPWSLGLAYGGFLLGENWEVLRSAMRPFDIPILILMVLAGAWFIYRRVKSIRAAALSSPDAAGPGASPPGAPQRNDREDGNPGSGP